MLKIEVIKSGRRFMKIKTGQLRQVINSLVEEKAFVAVNKRQSLAKERKWQKSVASALDSKEMIFVALFDNGTYVGGAEARKRIYNESHNVHFGIGILRKYRGKGAGRMLLQSAMAQARKTLKAKNLWIEYEEGNKIAANFYRSLGFVEVARLKNYVNHYGSYCDKILMGHKGNV